MVSVTLESCLGLIVAVAFCVRELLLICFVQNMSVSQGVTEVTVVGWNLKITGFDEGF